MNFPSRAFVVDSDVLVAAVVLWSSDGTKRAGICLLTGDLGDTKPHYLLFETSPLW